MQEAVKKLVAGDTLALSKLITLAEKGAPEMAQMMKELYKYKGNAYTIGITGPPGAGKSASVDRLTSHIRSKDKSVGIVAVDPSSPFSGGALLGDRIRMKRHFTDDGVFIRSMATRGALGGLAPAVGSVVKLMSVSGKDYILVETVGVGQAEIDIIQNTDTVALILVPEAGDSIQTMKAGILETADILVVNKTDRPGADNMVADLKAMVHSQAEKSDWKTPVIETQASNDIGIDKLLVAIEKHRRFLEVDGKIEQKRRKQRQNQFLDAVKQRVTAELLNMVNHSQEFAQYMEKIQSGEIDPFTAVMEIFKPGKLRKELAQALNDNSPKEPV